MFIHMFWDPPKELTPFSLPILGRPLLWYGALFALGFALAYGIVYFLLRHDRDKQIKSKAKHLAESLTFYVILGTVIGARLGDVLFYQSYQKWLHDPLSLVRVWEGGLASHGGAVGIIVALLLFVRKCHKEKIPFTFAKALDFVTLPAGLVGMFIRVGNFINQEILGTKTSVPWAVTFGHPADGSLPAARHPVQLYEALFYLFVFVLLWTLYRTRKWREGQLGGLFLVLVFTFRLGIECFKEEQSSLVGGEAFFTMGQILSLPLIAVGLYLFFRKR